MRSIKVKPDGLRKNYTMMPNGLNEKLSGDAIFLFYLIHSNKEGYFKSIKGLQAATGYKKEKWNRIFQELKTHGYVNVHKRQKDKSKKWEYTFVFDEQGKLPPQLKEEKKQKAQEEEILVPTKEIMEKHLEQMKFEYTPPKIEVITKAS